MTDEVKNSARVNGQAGRPPITAIELTENTSSAHTSTSESTKIEKPRVEKEKSPRLICGASNSPSSGPTRIGTRVPADSVRLGSAAEKMESRPVITDAESICMNSQSRSARCVRKVNAEK